MQEKMKEFNVIFTQKKNIDEPGVTDKEILNATQNEYPIHHNMKDFRYEVA